MNPTWLQKLTKPGLIPRMLKRVRRMFYVDQWIILLSTKATSSRPDWVDFQPIIPPPDRDWADPFVVLRDGRCYLFIEEKLYSTNRGRILCLTLDQDMSILGTQVVLEKPYHLSYPFVFEHDGQLYMVPESKGNHDIQLYRCRNFPYDWEFVKALISPIDAVDATLLQYQGQWWLFANVAKPGASSWDTLNLYRADDLLADEWIPHPLNPILHDVSRARPAGRILSGTGDLIRPSQDSAARYGGALNFNRIQALTSTTYREALEFKFQPPSRGALKAVHTWSESGNWVAIDAILRRPKFAAVKRIAFPPA